MPTTIAVLVANGSGDGIQNGKNTSQNITALFQDLFLFFSLFTNRLVFFYFGLLLEKTYPFPRPLLPLFFSLHLQHCFTKKKTRAGTRNVVRNRRPR